MPESHQLRRITSAPAELKSMFSSGTESPKVVDWVRQTRDDEKTSVSKNVKQLLHLQVPHIKQMYSEISRWAKTIDRMVGQPNLHLSQIELFLVLLAALNENSTSLLILLVPLAMEPFAVTPIVARSGHLPREI